MEKKEKKKEKRKFFRLNNNNNNNFNPSSFFSTQLLLLQRTREKGIETEQSSLHLSFTRNNIQEWKKERESVNETEKKERKKKKKRERDTLHLIFHSCLVPSLPSISLRHPISIFLSPTCIYLFKH